MVLFLNESSVIRRGNIIQYVPENRQTTSSVPSNTFSKIFNSKKLECSGKFSVLSITDMYKYELDYVDGKCDSYSHMQPKKKPVTSVTTESEGCIDWYLITVYTDEFGYTHYSEQFITQTCNCTPVGPTAPETLECSGGGGNNPFEGCCFDPDMQISVTSISEDAGTNCGLLGTDPVTGRPTKPCTYSWSFNKNTMGPFTWKYISIEEASLEKVAGVWKYKTFVHNGMGSSGAIPPCVSFSCNIGSATPSLSSDKTQARMDLVFTTSFNISCCPWCQPATETLTANDFWFAE